MTLDNITPAFSEDLAREIGRAFPRGRFERRRSDPKDNTQDNLLGRSFWATDDTLKAFGCRIASSRIMENGLFLVTLFSQQAGFKASDGREWNFIIHDISGQSVHRADSGFKTRAQAEKAMWAFLEEFDARGHYRELMADEVQRQARRIVDLSSAAVKIDA